MNYFGVSALERNIGIISYTFFFMDLEGQKAPYNGVRTCCDTEFDATLGSTVGGGIHFNVGL